MENRNNICPPVAADCSALLDSVSESHFFVHDLKLYLDTHPDDQTALEMFKEACKQYHACFEAFEKHCFPLRECGAGENGEWDWLCGAWPSERI